MSRFRAFLSNAADKVKSGALVALAIIGVPIVLLWTAIFIYWMYDRGVPVVMLIDDLPPPVEYPQLVSRAADKDGRSIPFIVSSAVSQGSLIVVGWPLSKLRMCPGGITVSAVSKTRNFAAPLSISPATLPQDSRGWFYFGYTVPAQLCPDRYVLKVFPRHTCNPLGDTTAVFEGPEFVVTGEEFAHCRAFRRDDFQGSGVE